MFVKVLHHSTAILTALRSVALQAAAQCYIDLIIKESDNNVKLIVLDRLIELKEHPTHERVLQVHSLTDGHGEIMLFSYANEISIRSDEIARNRGKPPKLPVNEFHNIYCIHFLSCC